jgi:predicted GNAT superfamily acetyltransferase
MASAAPAVTVRPVASVAEYRACQELQRRAWGITEDGYVVPIATMISVQHAGGLVLGAFIPDGGGERLAGFAFAYLGRVRGRWALYSQLAAVDESLRDLGLGGRLKQAQRDWAREQGLALVAWSFDPLQAGNANFNLHKLGAVCREYQVNFFGERSDALNAGLESDRLLAEWPVDDQPHAWPGGEAAPLDLVQRLPEPACVWDGAATAAALPLRIEIPSDIAALRAGDLPLAAAWQRAVRAAFLQAFSAGYVAMDVQRENGAAGRRVFYLLRRPAEPEGEL